MANKIGVAVQVDDGGAVRKINGISRAFDKLGGPGSGASLFGNVGAAAVAAGFNLIGDAAGAAIGFGLKSIDAFSKLEQATGGVDAVFGAASQSIRDFGKTAAETAGLSQREVFEMAAVIGAKLQGMGFTVADATTKTLELEKAGADMAATYGGTAVDAVDAISSALTGERDPIEKYGISIKEADVQAEILALGLKNTTSEEKKNATAVATLSLIQKGAAKTTGQFAAQNQTLAEKQQIANAKLENAQAVLGEKLAPIMTSLTNFMIDVVIPAIEALGRGWDKVQSFIRTDVTPAFDSLKRGIGKVSAFITDMIGRLTRGINKIKEFIKALGDALSIHSSGGSDPIGDFIFGNKSPTTISGGARMPSGTGGGLAIQGVSEKQILDMVDRGLYFRLQRAAPTLGRS